MPCLEHLAQLRERQQELDQLGAALLAVAKATPPQAAEFATREGLGDSLLNDPRGHAYTAFGLARAAPRRLLTGSTVASYARGLLHGRLPRWPRGDLAQLGGVFVLDPGGLVVFAHRGQDPADWPSVETILDAVRSAALSNGQHRS